MYNAAHEHSLCYVYIQVREVGLPGLMDPALIPVVTGPEQAPETAPLLTILTAALETAQWLRHVQKAVVLVSYCWCCHTLSHLACMYYVCVRCCIHLQWRSKATVA